MSFLLHALFKNCTLTVGYSLGMKIEAFVVLHHFYTLELDRDCLREGREERKGGRRGEGITHL